MSSSMSDGSSSTRESKASPVPYRVGPLEYQPAVMCRCRPPDNAARWISWSTDNPGRRYYKCQNARGLKVGFSLAARGCDFWAWCDGPTSSFIRELLNDLRDRVHSLRRDNEVMRKEVEQSRDKVEVQSKAMDDVHGVVAVKKAEIICLKARNHKLEKERKVFVICVLSCMFVLFVVLFGKK
uniref:GRF-type domain-containing protein n=1 Tax=Oryza punctata TaxID=4537 RepID=A0A0E0LSX1_ORYPU